MILYALIARSKDGTILAEQTIAGVSGGNFPQISIEVLQKVVPPKGRLHIQLQFGCIGHFGKYRQ